MQNKKLSSLGVSALLNLFLLATATSSHAALIFHPDDLVIYDERAPQNYLVAIQKLADGSEYLTLRSCDKDKWIGDAAAVTAHCHNAVPILPVSQFSAFVKQTAIEWEVQHPKTALTPIKAEDLAALVQALGVQNDPTNLAASTRINELNVDLASVNDMLVHLPNSPSYQSRRISDLSEIKKLEGANQAIAQAKAQAGRVESALNDLSESMLKIIRYNKAKNPNNAISTMNPMTEEPNSYASSQMDGTLLSAVIARLGNPGGSSLVLNGKKYVTDSDNGRFAVTVDGNLKQLQSPGTFCNTPKLFNFNGNAMIAVIYQKTYMYIYNVSSQNYSEIASPSEGFISIDFILTSGNNLTVIARKSDGKAYRRTIDLTQNLVSASSAWTCLN